MITRRVNGWDGLLVWRNRDSELAVHGVVLRTWAEKFRTREKERVKTDVSNAVFRFSRTHISRQSIAHGFLIKFRAINELSRAEYH